MMEALLAAKEALAIYRDLGEAHGEAAALVALAKIYRLKSELLLSIEYAKEAAVILQIMGDMQGAANALIWEATTYLMIGDGEVTIPDQRGGSRVSLPREEALCAATEALQIFESIDDKAGADSAEMTIESARELFRQPYGPAAKALRRAVPDATVVVDLEERDPLKGMGFSFKSQADIDLWASSRKKSSKVPNEAGIKTEKRLAYPQGVIQTEYYSGRSAPNAKMESIQKAFNGRS
jgi:hypothetical protein